MRLAAVLFVVLCASPAFAASLPLSDADLAPYKTKLDDKGNPAEPLAAGGDRFMAALKARDPQIWAAVNAATRIQVEEEAVAKMKRDQKFVLIAYGVIWAVLAAFAASVWLGARKLSQNLSDLEQRLAEAEADEG